MLKGRSVIAIYVDAKAVGTAYTDLRSMDYVQRQIMFDLTDKLPLMSDFLILVTASLRPVRDCVNPRELVVPRDHDAVHPSPVAEHKATQISKRTRDALDAARKRGKRPGAEEGKRRPPGALRAAVTAAARQGHPRAARVLPIVMELTDGIIGCDARPLGFMVRAVERAFAAHRPPDHSGGVGCLSAPN